MKYFINYIKGTGEIVGFLPKEKLFDNSITIEVTNPVYIKAQKHNKIIVDGDNISFDTVDWRTQAEKDEQYNNQILAQIIQKEKELIRPMRELLSNTATTENKNFAQEKVDTIETEIQELRNQLI